MEFHNWELWSPMILWFCLLRHLLQLSKIKNKTLYCKNISPRLLFLCFSFQSVVVLTRLRSSNKPPEWWEAEVIPIPHVNHLTQRVKFNISLRVKIINYATAAADDHDCGDACAADADAVGDHSENVDDFVTASFNLVIRFRALWNNHIKNTGLQEWHKHQTFKLW